MKNMAFGIAALAAALVFGSTIAASAQAPVAVYYPPAPAARPVTTAYYPPLLPWGRPRPVTSYYAPAYGAAYAPAYAPAPTYAAPAYTPGYAAAPYSTNYAPAYVPNYAPAYAPNYAPVPAAAAPTTTYYTPNFAPTYTPTTPVAPPAPAAVAPVAPAAPYYPAYPIAPTTTYPSSVGTMPQSVQGIGTITGAGVPPVTAYRPIIVVPQARGYVYSRGPLGFPRVTPVAPFPSAMVPVYGP